LHFLPASQSRVEAEAVAGAGARAAEAGAGAAGAEAAGAVAAAALGGDHSAGILRAGSPRELRRVGLAAVGADRGAEAPPPRALA